VEGADRMDPVASPSCVTMVNSLKRHCTTRDQFLQISKLSRALPTAQDRHAKVSLVKHREDLTRSSHCESWVLKDAQRFTRTYFERHGLKKQAKFNGVYSQGATFTTKRKNGGTCTDMFGMCGSAREKFPEVIQRAREILRGDRDEPIVS